MFSIKQRLEEEFARQREEQERFYGSNMPFLHEFTIGGLSEHSFGHNVHTSASGSSSCSPVSTPGAELSSHSFHS